jgi:hypothetical protein
MARRRGGRPINYDDFGDVMGDEPEVAPPPDPGDAPVPPAEPPLEEFPYPGKPPIPGAPEDEPSFDEPPFEEPPIPGMRPPVSSPGSVAPAYTVTKGQVGMRPYRTPNFLDPSRGVASIANIFSAADGGAEEEERRRRKFARDVVNRNRRSA